MDYPQRKHPGLKEYDYSQNVAYFLTICTQNKEPILCSVMTDRFVCDENQLGMEQIKLTDMGEICQRYLESIPAVYQGVFLDEYIYIIMPDHVHILLRLEHEAGTGGQGSGRPTVQKIVHG